MRISTDMAAASSSCPGRDEGGGGKLELFSFSARLRSLDTGMGGSGHRTVVRAETSFTPFLRCGTVGVRLFQIGQVPNDGGRSFFHRSRECLTGTVFRRRRRSRPSLLESKGMEEERLMRPWETSL